MISDWWDSHSYDSEEVAIQRPLLYVSAVSHRLSATNFTY
jgi:hypothetical protein